jgi:hypothetical protein
VALLHRPYRFATAAGAAALLALPASSAAAAERDIPDAGAPVTLAGAKPHEFAVFPGNAPRAARAARAHAASKSYSTPDGYSVGLEVSPSYPPDREADQALVDFLGSRLHGPELSALRVYVGTPTEIQRICGGDPRVVACYAIGEGRMFVPGESIRGIPVEYPLTHEYGHHVASRRLNSPWLALDWGAKYWASAMRICTYVERGRLFPGNQGAHYRDDPGEGFADGYAHLHYPEVPWQFNRLMRPDKSAFDAIRRDVLHPWTGPRTRTFRARLGPARTTRRFRIPVRLDGNMSLHLSAPAGGTYSVSAEAAGHAAGRVMRSGGAFGIEWCRRRPAERVTLTVHRQSGAGPVALKVRWAG